MSVERRLASMLARWLWSPLMCAILSVVDCDSTTFLKPHLQKTQTSRNCRCHKGQLSHPYSGDDCGPGLFAKPDYERSAVGFAEAAGDARVLTCVVCSCCGFDGGGWSEGFFRFSCWWLGRWLWEFRQAWCVDSSNSPLCIQRMASCDVSTVVEEPPI